MTKDEALKLAMEALKTIDEAMPFPVAKLAQAAIKEALAQPEPWEKFCDSNCVWTDHHPDCKLAQQEPYCWTWDVWVSGGKWRAEYGWEKPTKKVVNLQPLYTAPPQRKPLSFEQVEDCFPEGAIFAEDDGWLRVSAQTLHDYARAIEAAHGIKGEA